MPLDIKKILAEQIEYDFDKERDQRQAEIYESKKHLAIATAASSANEEVCTKNRWQMTTKPTLPTA